MKAIAYNVFPRNMLILQSTLEDHKGNVTINLLSIMASQGTEQHTTTQKPERMHYNAHQNNIRTPILRLQLPKGHPFSHRRFFGLLENASRATMRSWRWPDLLKQSRRRPWRPWVWWWRGSRGRTLVPMLVQQHRGRRRAVRRKKGRPADIVLLFL